MLGPQTTSPRFATIIHLGAGEGDRLQEFRDHGARQIILLEPAVEAAKALEHMAMGCKKTRVINAAAAERDGQADLRLWNLARLNSLVPVGPQMHELYPGLRQRSQQSVRLLSPRSLLAEIGQIERPVLLVVETPGTELDTLKGWKADGLIEQIDQIELHCAEEALYEGAATRGALEAWLAEEGFDVTARDRDDPDWTVLHLRADHTARALKRAEAQAQAEERNKAVTDLGLALRMQGLLQSDLDDLRERYRRSEEIRASQEALLRKLTPRLQEAAHQLRQLQLVAEPDAAPEIVAATTTRANPKARATTARKRATKKKSADGK